MKPAYAIRSLYYSIDGKKTYIIAFITAAINLAVAYNLVSPEHLAQINTVLAALGVATVRSAINKV